MSIGLKEVFTPPNSPTPTTVDGLTSWPFDTRTRDARVQSLSGLYIATQSHSFDLISPNATVQSASVAMQSWAFDSQYVNARSNALSVAQSWAFDSESPNATRQNPLTAPTTSTPGVVTPKEKITFTYDFSGLQVSEGATLTSSTTTAKADGSIVNFLAVNAAPVISDFKAHLGGLTITPRSNYGPFVSLEQTTSGGGGFNGWLSSHANVSRCSMLVNVSPGTIGYDSVLALEFNGETLGYYALGSTLSWNQRIESMPLFQANGWAVACTSYVSKGTRLVDWNAPKFVHLIAEVYPAICGGYYTMSTGGYTATIPYDATESQIAALLNALPSVAANGGVRVTLERQDLERRNEWAAATRYEGQIYYYLPITNEHRLTVRQTL